MFNIHKYFCAIYKIMAVIRLLLISDLSFNPLPYVTPKNYVNFLVIVFF